MKPAIDSFTDEEAEKIIPHGLYCYDACGSCPFWDCDPSKDKQENGYCHFLKEGDWESEGISLLWDRCKECEINID